MLMEQFHACALVCQVTNIFLILPMLADGRTHTPRSSLSLQTPAPHYERAQQARGSEQEGNRIWRMRWWRKAKKRGAAKARNIGRRRRGARRRPPGGEGEGRRRQQWRREWPEEDRQPQQLGGIRRRRWIEAARREGLQQRQQADDSTTLWFNSGQDWCSVAVQQTSWLSVEPAFEQINVMSWKVCHQKSEFIFESVYFRWTCC